MKPTWRPRYRAVRGLDRSSRAATRTQPATKDAAGADRRASRSRQKADSARSRPALQLEHAVLPLAAQRRDVLHRRQPRAQVDASAATDLYPISPDLSQAADCAKIDTSMNTDRRHHARCDRRRDVRHGRGARGVARAPGLPLRRHRRRQRLDHARTTARRGSRSRRSASRACRAATCTSARIEPSHFDSLTFYVAFDNHRWNDFTPYLYVTNDCGKTFQLDREQSAERSGADFVHVVREDPYNRDLLFVGTRASAHTSRSTAGRAGSGS